MKNNHTTLMTMESITPVIEKLSQQRMIGFDLETEGLEWWGEHRICGIGLGYIANRNLVNTYYIPIGHLDHTVDNGKHITPWDNPEWHNADPWEVLEALKPIFADEDVRKVGANVKFDAHFVLQDDETKLVGLDDIQLMARLLRTEYYKVGLKHLVEAEFDDKHEEEIELKAWFRKNKIKCSQKFVEPYAYAKAPIELASRYCGKDVYWTLLLALKYLKELNADKKLLSLYEKVERPMIPVIIEMEANGIKVDTKYLDSLREELAQDIEVIKKGIYAVAGKEFNIDSNPELQEVLIEAGVKPQMRRRKKNDGTTEKTPSFDAATLEEYKDSIPLVQSILNYRELNKILGTYVEPMLDKARNFGNGTAGKIHASIVQEAARTGRMSCLDPNLTNLPRG